MASTSVNIPIQSDNDLQSPSGSAVRSNGLLLLRSSWNNISRVNKFMIISSIFFILSQIAVSIVVLILYKDKTCDKPLDTYLIVYAIRIFLLLPLLIYRYSRRPLTPQQLLQQRQQQREDLYRNRIQAQQNSTNSSITSTSNTHNSQASTSVHPPISSSPNRTNNSTTNEWCDKAKSLLDLFGILWFIVGNYLVFTTENCTYMAPAFYYTVLTWILLGYLIVLIPVLLCASIVFCLPFVLLILQALQINNVPGITNGASQNEINKIPIFKYKEMGEDQANNNNNISAAPLNIKKNNQPKKKSWFRKSFFKKSNSDEENNYPPITIHPTEDALCSICLCEYENDELVCKLWCKHHFHKDCIHQWVGLNYKCPLCNQDFRGKQYNENNEENDTELSETR